MLKRVPSPPSKACCAGSLDVSSRLGYGVQLFGQALTSMNCEGIFNVTHISIRGSEGRNTLHHLRGPNQPAELRFPEEGILRTATQNRALRGADSRLEQELAPSVQLQPALRRPICKPPQLPEPEPQKSTNQSFPFSSVRCVYKVGSVSLENPDYHLGSRIAKENLGRRGERGM